MKIALISDIHEDVVSLRLALEAIEKKGCDEIYCLGDISGFSVPYYGYFDTRNAHECLRLVKENCKVVLAGNHDLHASKRLSTLSHEFNFPNNWYELDYCEREKISQEKVWLYDHDELDPLYKKADIEYLKTLPELYIHDIHDKKIMFSHYIYPNLSGVLKAFYHARNEYSPHFNFMDKNVCEYSFVGHAHSGGIYFATEEKTIQKGFRRKYMLHRKTCMVIPSIAGNQKRHGYCIFDTDEWSVKAYPI